jgi:hypothetical protein
MVKIEKDGKQHGPLTAEVRTLNEANTLASKHYETQKVHWQVHHL